MIIDVLLFIAGVALMFKGSDFVVDASVAIGKRARLPNLVVGGTLVSLATTSPELTVSIVSGIDKTPGLAIGNALGSAAFNMGFIFAFAAIIRTFEFSPGELKWRALMMLGLVALLFLMTIDLSLAQWRGFVLIAIGIVYLFIDYRRGLRRYAEHGEAIGSTQIPKLTTVKKIVFFFISGAVMVIGGSILLEDSGTAIATALGVRPLFIGLTMVSVGTSLPELATAIAAIRKHVFDLSVGNIIGASVLNLTIVTGTAAAIYPLSLTRTTQIYTFPAIFLIFTVFFLLIRSNYTLTRREGSIIMSLYMAFIAGLTLFNVL
jgi:cation:H+ antiporter